MHHLIFVLGTRPRRDPDKTEERIGTALPWRSIVAKTPAVAAAARVFAAVGRHKAAAI